MTNDEAIKEAIRLVKLSRSACCMTARKKPTTRMRVMENLINQIRIKHMYSCKESKSCNLCDFE